MVSQGQKSAAAARVFVRQEASRYSRVWQDPISRPLPKAGLKKYWSVLLTVITLSKTNILSLALNLR